jgi:hypothetical protein
VPSNLTHLKVHWTKWFECEYKTAALYHTGKSLCTMKCMNLPAVIKLLESSFLNTNELKSAVCVERALLHHAWFTTDKCFTLHCPGAASRRLGHWRCRETSRGKRRSRTGGCEPQGSLIARTCLLWRRDIGASGRIMQVFLKQQQYEKEMRLTSLN